MPKSAAFFTGAIGLKPKAPEPKLNLAMIRTCEGAYLNAFGRYVATGTQPPGEISQKKRRWTDDAGFKMLGCHPEGPTRCSYAVASDGSAYTATAICPSDIPGDIVAWGIVVPNEESGVGVPGPFGYCGAVGVIDDLGNLDMLSSVGPCRAQDQVAIQRMGLH